MLLRKIDCHICVFIMILGGLSCNSDKGNNTKFDLTSFKEIENEALPGFELPPGFKIELIAAEPMISDPVDMAIDAAGNMYVVEMHGYPLDKMGVDKVILLKDSDGDGIMDQRIVFADSLVMPDGIMAWRNGVIVTAAPNILYMEDTDGDGKADVIDTLLSGFALSNPQHNVNTPRFGLDNWIYLAHQGTVNTNTYEKEFGDKGGDIYFPDNPKGPRLPDNANGLNVRFKPDNHKLEELAASTQFGQTWNAWGDHFLVSNANHIYSEVMGGNYIKRNPNFVISSITENLSDHGNAADVYPITKNPEHQLLTDVGVFTSACAILDYLGDAFPEEFNHDMTLVCEPVSNIVHADRIKSNGATFTASRILKNDEFLASTDAWFRPVHLYIGPDGALYVLDYHREIIEHPEWLSEDVIKSGRLYNGSDQGRIYRISGSDGPKAKWMDGLDIKNIKAEDWVGKLADGNIWWRNTAQRLLIEQQDEKVVPLLKRMIERSDADVGRLHALWTLEGMGRLSTREIRWALEDSVAGIRKNAIQLAELHLKEDSATLVPALVGLKEDQDPQVRFQLLLTLGFIEDPEVDVIRRQLLFRDMEDPWVQDAALSSSFVKETKLLDYTLSRFDNATPAFSSLIQKLGAMVGMSADSKIVYGYLQKAMRVSDKKIDWQPSLLNGIAQGIRRNHEITLSESILKEMVVFILRDKDLKLKRGVLNILRNVGLPNNLSISSVIAKAEVIAEDKDLKAENRAIAIEFLSFHDSKSHVKLFERLLRTQEPSSVQNAALNALSTIPGLGQTQFILSRWGNLSPTLRSRAINLFLQDPNKVALLLDNIESGEVKRSDISWPQSVSIMVSGDNEQKNRARSLLEGADLGNKELIRRYTEKMKELKKDPEKGKSIFAANCAVCHQVRGKRGRAFGPDLGTVQSWGEQTILVNILDPNLSISRGYDTWELKLLDGKTFQGIITSETPTALTIEDENADKMTVSRDEIESMQALGVSIMPTDLGDNINPQQMADLIAFLKNEK